MPTKNQLRRPQARKVGDIPSKGLDDRPFFWLAILIVAQQRDIFRPKEAWSDNDENLAPPSRVQTIIEMIFSGLIYHETPERL
jgi:hypothetical protein